MMHRLALLLGLLALAGCAAVPQADRVAGIYRAANPDFNFGGEVRLRSDFTYTFTWRRTEHFTFPDGSLPSRTDTETGRWRPVSGGVIFTDGKSEAVHSGRDCWLWGRYRMVGADLHPINHDKAGWVWLKKI